MTKIILFVLIMAFVLATIIMYAECARVIFRKNSALVGNTQDSVSSTSDNARPTDVAVSNIITAPINCPAGQQMDGRKICRRVCAFSLLKL